MPVQRWPELDSACGHPFAPLWAHVHVTAPEDQCHKFPWVIVEVPVVIAGYPVMEPDRE